MKRIVTSQQLSEGYLEMIEGIVYHRQYSGVVARGDGTYVVDEPQIKPIDPKRLFRTPIQPNPEHP